jgi:hypothetical protein
MKLKKKPLSYILVTAILMTTASCGFRSTATDPAALEAHFETVRLEERELITKIVEDPQRTRTLFTLLDERDQKVAEHAATVLAYIDNMRTLNADYDAPQADFEQLFASYRANRQTYQKDLVNIVQKMKANTTAKEWKRLAKFQLDELNPRRMTQPSGGA